MTRNFHQYKSPSEHVNIPYKPCLDNINICQLCGSHISNHYEHQTIHVRKLKEIELIIPMILWCPQCKERHIDIGEFATKPHHTHACQYCGMVWRPSIINTVGVQFLPGFKNDT